MTEQINIVIGILALVLALYGAGLSTYLAILERRRKIKVFLEFALFTHRVGIVVTNVGSRPIKISAVGVAIRRSEDRNGGWEEIPAGAFVDPEMSMKKLPTVLTDGESITLMLSRATGDILFDKVYVNSENRNVRITVQDTEGKSYTDYKVRTFNEKWGTYADKDD